MKLDCLGWSRILPDFFQTQIHSERQWVDTVELDVIATEMLAVPSKSSRNHMIAIP